MSSPPPRFQLPDTGRRDLLIALACGLGVLGLIAAGIFALSREQGAPSSNRLTGTIVAKHVLGEKESEISFGTKGLKARETVSGYSFDIEVPAEHRTYEVPVSKFLFDSSKVGDRQSFIRPPSEQR